MFFLSSFITCSIFLLWTLLFTNILLITSAYDCGNVSSCSDKLLQLDAELLCDGYLSCAESDILRHGYSIQSRGRGGAQNSGLIVGSNLMNGRAYLSFSWSSNVTMNPLSSTTGIMNCEAESSCSHLQLFDVYANYCEGFKSCVNNIGQYNRASKLYGLGAFSWQNSVVYSSTTNFTAEFRGYYSGYNGTIYCMPNHTCNINCYSTGCANLTVNCFGNTNDCNIVIGCNETSGILCPNNYNYSYNFSQIVSMQTELSSVVDDQSLSYLMSSFSKVYASDTKDLRNNNECINGNNNYSLSYICGDRQDENCYNQTFIFNMTSNDNEVFNYGICCYGSNCCGYSTFRAARSSFYGDEGIDVISNGTIVCDGWLSCRESKFWIDINSSLIDVQTSNTSIECRGMRSCFVSQLSNFGKILATGEAGVEGATITNTYFVGCFGDVACENAKFHGVENIFGLGWQALRGTQTFSNGKNVSIYALGYNSTFKMRLHCQENDYCRIYCQDEMICNNVLQLNADSANTYINCYNCCLIELIFLYKEESFTLAHQNCSTISTTTTTISNTTSTATSTATGSTTSISTTTTLTLTYGNASTTTSMHTYSTRAEMITTNGANVINGNDNNGQVFGLDAEIVEILLIVIGVVLICLCAIIIYCIYSRSRMQKQVESLSIAQNNPRKSGSKLSNIFHHKNRVVSVHFRSNSNSALEPNINDDNNNKQKTQEFTGGRTKNINGEDTSRVSGKMDSINNDSIYERPMHVHSNETRSDNEGGGRGYADEGAGAMVDDEDEQDEDDDDDDDQSVEELFVVGNDNDNGNDNGNKDNNKSFVGTLGGATTNDGETSGNLNGGSTKIGANYNQTRRKTKGRNKGDSKSTKSTPN